MWTSRKWKHIKQIRISLSNFRRGTGFQKVKDLELLRISDCDKEDLRELFCSEKMKYLMIFYSRLRNLDHIETAPNLKWVQLEELKRLEDISALEHIAESVEALCISGCPKVKDFSVLEKKTGKFETFRVDWKKWNSEFEFFESNASDTDVFCFRWMCWMEIWLLVWRFHMCIVKGTGSIII